MEERQTGRKRNILLHKWRQVKLFVFSIHQCLSSHRYEGLFSAGKFNGKGIFFYGSLDKYEGDFINGRWGWISSTQASLCPGLRGRGS